MNILLIATSISAAALTISIDQKSLEKDPSLKLQCSPHMHCPMRVDDKAHPNHTKWIDTFEGKTTVVESDGTTWTATDEENHRRLWEAKPSDVCRVDLSREHLANARSRGDKFLYEYASGFKFEIYLSGRVDCRPPKSL